MNNHVLISIILPAYNAENTIAETIQSIINQTYKNWELIVINDGSTDSTETVVKSFIDGRIHYYKNNTNKHLIYTLNRGIDLAMGKYIARMDADDICMPERFEKQVAFMEENPKVIVCGTQIKYFGTKSNSFKKLVFPEHDRDLKDMLAMSTCFAHPSVMLRRDVLIENNVRYDKCFKNAEDYAMWVELMPLGEFANLPDALLNYRVSDTQISQPSNPQTRKSVIACHKKYLYKFVAKGIVDNIFEAGCDISIIKQLRKAVRNKRILEACYLSLSKFDLRSATYFFFSGDFLALGFGATIRFVKRLIVGPAPIYFDVK